jgi:uncharacterized protein YggU (UPF0235/DUF167 family)
MMPIQKEFVIYLTPGSKNEYVGETVEDENGRPMLKVFVSAKPENNKANKALIEVLASHFKIPKSNVTIKNGHRSRKKTILLSSNIKT